MTDSELLCRYRAGSQEAFAELRGRHVDWVYSAALRRVRDSHLAEDVTQAVFIALAQAGPAHQGAVMSGWLFRVMRFTASKAVRSESRRKRREQSIAKPELQVISDAEWSELAPLLDEAVAGLGQKDSQAVLLRFYERKSMADVGGALGLSEEGARKRISRAVEKLRRFFAEHGYPMAAPALAGVLQTHVVGPAPLHLVALQAAVAPAAATLAKGALQMVHRTRMIRVATMLLGASAAVAAVCIGAAVFTTTRPAQAQVQAQTESGKTLSLPAIRIVPSATTLPATQPTSLNIDQVIAGVQQAEKAFSNLYIKDFRTTIDIMPKGEIKWKPSPMVSTGSAWFDGDAMGKQRVYFSMNVMPWVSGPFQPAKPGDVAWAGQEIDYSWDGREGREVNVTAGLPDERKMRDNTAMIRPERPALLGRYSRSQTGAAMTIQYRVVEEFQSAPHKPLALLSEAIAKGAANGHPAELSQQMVNGFDTVRLRWKWSDSMTSLTYWLAPLRGFALVKQEEVLDEPNYWRVEGMNVFALKEAAKGAWFPISGDMIEENAGPGEYWRYNFSAADVVANDPKFDSAIFTAKIPAGYNVTDVRRELRCYTVMPDGSEKETHRGDAMPRVKVARPRRPDAKD